MRILNTIDETKQAIRKLKEQGKIIGFVPTMGYLHEGHIHLIEACKKENDITVVSIFVNPAQFAPTEDFNRYPRDVDRDVKMLEKAGADLLFCPEIKEVYPEGYATYIEVEKMGKVLCGKNRPTHFRGVLTVVLKLFNITSPHHAYFGQKDAQQAIIIKKMSVDLNLDVCVRTIPTVRDADGLALSSRNSYLSTGERSLALYLPGALDKARLQINSGLRNAEAVKQLIRNELNRHSSIRIDYVDAVDLERLEDVETVELNDTLIAAAIWVGKTRLIDNFILGEI